jgi:hypothetical protein
MKGSIVLDFGLRYCGPKASRFNAGILSHFHSDHSGGVFGFMKANQKPVYMSKGTFAYLYRVFSGTPEQTLLSIFSRIVSVSADILMRDGSRISIFPVYHCPGAIGISYSDENRNRLVYMGDFCLSNAFRDFRHNAIKIVAPIIGGKTSVALDAAMVKRKSQQISTCDTPRKVLADSAAALGSRNVFIITPEGESMVYTYISAYQTAISVGIRTPVLVPQSLFVQLYVLWDSILKAGGKFKDPVLKSGVSAISLNFAESQQLYPINACSLSSIPMSVPTLVFAELATFNAYPELGKRIPKSDVILAGALALREDIPEQVLKQRPRQILRVASPDWSFHSNEDDLAEFCRICADHNHDFYLFHNYQARIRSFIRDFAIPPNKAHYGTRSIVF